MGAPRLAFFHDSRHPLIYMYETPMAREQHEAAVDELIGTPVDALMFCLGDGRTVLHDTQVGELWGHNVEHWPHMVFRRAHHNARTTIERGEDPLRIVSERARAKGLAFYPSLLVQQGRGAREQDVRCSEFRFDHVHLEIGAKGGIATEEPAFTCLDFMHEEVRQERLGLIREVIEGYEINGFELQLNYAPHYFHPDDLEQGRQVMTGWVRQIRQCLQDSGPERSLVVRVPASFAACDTAGLAVTDWIQEGLVDVVVAETSSGPELVDVGADVSQFVDAAAGSKVDVMGVVQSLVDSDRQYQGSIETIRAAACNLWAQGVDGLYLGHWFGNWPYDATFYEKLRELIDPEVMAPKDKQYFVTTTSGRYPQRSSGTASSLQLPVDLVEGQWQQVSWPTSDDLPRWRQAERVHDVLLRVRLLAVTESDRIRFRLNGQPLASENLRRIDETYRMRAPRYRVGSACWYVFRLSPEQWPPAGHQILEVLLEHRAPDAAPAVTIRDVEFDVQYLMGRAHRRSHNDPDLGQTTEGNL
jgi:hypothetical protein